MLDRCCFLIVHYFNFIINFEFQQYFCSLVITSVFALSKHLDFSFLLFVYTRACLYNNKQLFLILFFSISGSIRSNRILAYTVSKVIYAEKGKKQTTALQSYLKCYCHYKANIVLLVVSIADILFLYVIYSSILHALTVCQQFLHNMSLRYWRWHQMHSPLLALIA